MYFDANVLTFQSKIVAWVVFLASNYELKIELTSSIVQTIKKSKL